MSVADVPGVADTHYVDTGAFEGHGHVSTYIVDGAETTVVDPGFSTRFDRLLSALDDLSLEPESVDHIVLTHIHLDHAGAAGALASACPNATVHCHEIGVGFLSDAGKLERLLEGVRAAVGGLAELYGTAEMIPEERFDVLHGGETLALGNRTVEVIHAPGHAPHQVALYDPANRALFPGDECGEYLDGEVYPTTPPPNFDLERTLDSLDRFRELDVETILHPHYGPAPAGDVLDTYGSTLREWVAAVETARETHGDDEAVIEAFVGGGDHPKFDVWTAETAAEIVRMDVVGVLTYLDDKEDT